MAANVGNLGPDQVKVVEQPLGCRRDELAGPDIGGQRLVGAAQDPRVVFEPRPDARGAGTRIDGETGRQCLGTFVNTLGAEDGVPKGGVGRRRRPPPPRVLETCAQSPPRQFERSTTLPRPASVARADRL